MKRILVVVVLVAMAVFVAPAWSASNPFEDVPAGHWSYDAVALLASCGVISGFPNGQYKGARLATRYEMASVVARALVYVDEGKASKEALELVKKLVTEYKNELDALGVKIANLDERFEGLEKGLKGLHVTGLFWLDAEFGGRENGTTQPKFEYHGTRLLIDKIFDENSSFQLRISFDSLVGKETKSFNVDRLWFVTKLPWNIKSKFGYQTNDWDSEYGLYDTKYGGWGDEDSFFTNLRFMGFDFRKDFGKFDFDFWVGRNTQNIDGFRDVASFENQSYMIYATKLGYKSETLKLGIFGRYAKFDGDADDNSVYRKQLGNITKVGDMAVSLDGANIVNYGVYANFKFLEGALQLKGSYNHQQFMGTPVICKCTSYDKVITMEECEDSGLKNADSWTVIAEADQSFVKLFSLWLQYAKVDKGFIHHQDTYNEIGYQTILANYGAETGFVTADYQLFKVGIHRNFTKKLKGYLLCELISNKSDMDIDRTKNFAIGFRYQYTPAIAFQLQYDWRDYGHGASNKYFGREDVFRFRTVFSF